MQIWERRTLAAGVLSALVAVLGLQPGAAVAADGNPLIVTPAATDALYEGYTGPFEVDFTQAPPTETTYNYAVFSDPVDGPTKLVAGPYQYLWHGVGANPHLMVKPLNADDHLRFKITDGAGHEAELVFQVRPGPQPRCSLVVPTRIRVAAPLMKVSGRLSSNCATLDTQTADWKVTLAGRVLDYYRFKGNTTDTWSVYDGDPMGRYAILPLSARSSVPADVAQNSPSVVVLRDSRVRLSASRSGDQVTLRAVVSRYSAPDDGFRRWAAKPVLFSVRSCSTCAWRSLRTVTTSSLGAASARLTAGVVRSYRVVVGGTTTIWSSTDYFRR